MASKIKPVPKILGFAVIAGGIFFAVKHYLPGQGSPVDDADAGPAASATATPVAAKGFSLRLTGSSTIGQALAPKLAAAFLSNVGATNIQQNEDKAHERTDVTATLQGQPATIAISYPGSSAAFDCLFAKTCDIGLSSRPIEPAEEAKLAGNNMHTPDTEHVIAMDGIAVVVNNLSRVATLTVPQVADIFLGRSTDWSQVGGSSGKIHVFSRDMKSGTYDSFVHMALGGQNISPSRGPILNDNESVASSVGGDPLGVGFVGLAYISTTGIKPLSLAATNTTTPLSPSFFTVGTEDYALSRRLYFYTPQSPTADWTNPFVSFVLSEAGQRIVSQVGFVSLNVETNATPLSGNSTPAYSRATVGKTRLSFDIRFQFGSTNLDGKALGDIPRLTAFVKARGTQNVALFGFADNQGAEASNLQISKGRAQAVANQLANAGILATANGFGSAMPVASNDTPEGRERNRRVEVWVQ
jgi:phosphate transport system substrate-binding protein